MRVGFNPHKDEPIAKAPYIHQVILPVFIPNQEGYFADCLRILKLCLESLFATAHAKTFITVVNNGSDSVVTAYLESLFREGKIHEVINTANIGKVNAILKGMTGHNIELVTIADSDVMFLSGWQQETDRVFAAIPRAGVVGLVPQYRTFMTRCDNMLWEKWHDKRLKFLPVKNPKGLEYFYKSVAWPEFVPMYHKLALGYETDSGLSVYLGAGHVVATYKKQMFDEIVTFIGYKMGGPSEDYLDQCPLKKDYWRLTTYDNFAYHMGNTYEDWMGEIEFTNDEQYQFHSDFPTYGNINKIKYFLKTKVMRKLFKSKKFRMLFYRYKKMPREMIAKY